MTSQLLVVVGLTLAVIPHALPAAARSDPAARGLDLFVHAPDRVAAGGRLPVQVRVFGFLQVSKLAPLAGATIEATWDPESTGKPVASAPPVVSAKSDAVGCAHLEIDVPHGKGKLRLLLSARSGEHQRTRELEIERLDARTIDLRVSDRAVVPGGTLSAWAFVRDTASGKAVARVPVDVELREGTFTRLSRRLLTDTAGMVATQVPVPFTEDPDARWTLSARTALGSDDDVSATQPLSVREETPSAPSLAVHWTQSSARPGTRAAFRVEARDGTREPLAKLPLRYWVGPRGTSPPTEDAAWERASTAGVTDAAGVAVIAVDTPSTIPRRGSTLLVAVRANAQGHVLSERDTLALETPRPELELIPEFGALLPGQPQRLFVHATFGGAALSADLALEGHGLSARVHTNERGWGEAAWRVPREIGATLPGRLEGGCAGEVAATVHVHVHVDARPLARSPAPGAHPEPFAICVKVDRDASAAIRPARPLARAGDPIAVHLVGDVAGAAERKAGAAAASVVLMAPDRAVAASGWLDRAGAGASVRAPDAAMGLWSLSATESNRPRAEAGNRERPRVLAGNVLVVPNVLPRLRASRVAGPPARGGTVELDADLGDGRGQPLTGSIGAVVVDARGGGRVDPLLALDTRRALVAGFGVADADIDGFLEGDGRFDGERWAALARSSPEPLAAAVDPVASVDTEIDRVFSAIVRSLEGGVFEASGDPERLRDVRIGAPGHSALNPEMMTLTTDAMPEAPTTPGGEPWRLADLMVVDRQVTYDKVARRVARLKLFRVLAAIRDYIHEQKLDGDEPMLRDPNALLRRLVRGHTLQASDLLDPWAHDLVFVRDSGPRVPFLSVVPGQRLISAGPDGRAGTADDVRDPFQRVLAPKTPYAKAVDEDRLVDARWDMRVGDDTVAAWKETMEALTGTELGGSGGLGMAGTGDGGGYGNGAGGLGGVGHGRSTHGIDVGPAIWLPPVRTDEHGHARLVVPLPDGETTWQVVLVGVPDGSSPAVTSVDVPVTLPLSVTVRAGAAWIVGDRVGVSAELRNRTDRALRVFLRVAAGGAAALADGTAPAQAITVPAGATVDATLFVVARTVGTAILDVRASAAGIDPDAVHHEWAIRPAGERTVLADAIWVDRSATLALPSGSVDGAAPTEPGHLVLERGPTAALAAVLESVRPESLHGLRALADALEICGRIRTWALVRGGETDPLAVRARAVAAEVAARLGAQARDKKNDAEAPLEARAQLWRAIALPSSDGDARERHGRSGQSCPPPSAPSVQASLEWLDGAPRAERGTEPACWAAFTSSTLQRLAGTGDPLQLARAAIAVGDRPGDAVVAGALADRVRAAVPIGADGTLALPGGYAADRAARSIVMAALVRVRHLGGGAAASGAPAIEAAAGRLWTRLLVERDAAGGYGSIQATRLVLPALLGTPGASAAAAPPATIDWSEVTRDGVVGARHRLTLGAAAPVTVALSATAAAVRIETSSPGLIARIERAALRPFVRTTEAANGPLHLDLELPRAPRAGATAPLQVSLRHDLGRSVPVVVRVPLPPGAALAEPVSGVRQVQGTLYVSTQLDSDPLPRVVAIPLRFALAGAVTWPEAVGRVDDDELPPTRAPARPMVIEGAR